MASTSEHGRHWRQPRSSSNCSARWIGHYPIRVRGTFGGSIAHADAASEWCLLAVLLDARIVLRSLDGERTLPATEFFLGLYETAADPGEMITEVWFPRPARQAALGGVGTRPLLLDTDELAGAPATAATWRAAGELAAAAIDPPSDGHGSGDYRKRLAATLVTRALTESTTGATGA